MNLGELDTNIDLKTGASITPRTILDVEFKNGYRIKRTFASKVRLMPHASGLLTEVQEQGLHTWHTIMVLSTAETLCIDIDDEKELFASTSGF